MRFTSKDSLARHKENLHDRVRHTCDKCGKDFGSGQTLKKHIKVVHEGFVPYTCEHCQKGFNLKGLLRDHILMVHKGINPYVCEFCNKVFTQAHMMKTHIKNNTCRKVII